MLQTSPHFGLESQFGLYRMPGGLFGSTRLATLRADVG